MTTRARLGKAVYCYLDRWLNHHPGYTRRIVYVAHSVHESELANGHAPSNLSTVIPNGIDLAPYSQVKRQSTRQEFTLPPKAKVVTFVGRLDQQKGVDILIAALPLLGVQESDYRVWIVGDGDSRSDLESQVQRSGVSDKVKFWGHRENIPEMLTASDIFVLPSRYEGMSISLLHALAAGLPSVVTRVGDNHKVVIDGDNGLVVPPDDSQTLAQALEKILADDNLRDRMAKAALETAQLYSEENMVNQVQRVYNECLR
jgi:glycosyltransferase involved in cell wall biosynthesis